MPSGAAPKEFLFTLFDAGGAVPPMLAAASKLIRKGHRIRVLSDPTTRDEVIAAGAQFISWIRAPHRLNRAREHDPLRDWEAATPEEGVRRVIDRFMCGPALAYAQDTIAELKRESADLVVSHDMLFGVFAGCESHGQKLTMLSPNISMFPLPGVPPFGPGFKPASNDAEQALHEKVAAAVEQMFDYGLPALNAARATLGLPALAHVLAQAEYAMLHLLATSRAFDFPSSTLPDRVRYVGPQLADPAWVERWQSSWPANDPRPLVLIGFSTTFQNHTQVLQNLLNALAEMPVRALLTLGGVIRPDELHAPANAVLMHSAPHSIVMREAALVVTHGGHGTVMAALCRSLPMLIVPHGRDQSDNAVRVTERGAGLALPPTASVEEFRSALIRLLNDKKFKAAAEALGQAVSAEAEHSAIVEELEEAASAEALPHSRFAL